MTQPNHSFQIAVRPPAAVIIPSPVCYFSSSNEFASWHTFPEGKVTSDDRWLPRDEAYKYLLQKLAEKKKVPG